MEEDMHDGERGDNGVQKGKSSNQLYTNRVVCVRGFWGVEWLNLVDGNTRKGLGSVLGGGITRLRQGRCMKWWH